MTRILVVERDDADAARLRDALGARPEWEVVRVANAMDAVRLAGEVPFDAAVMDDDLPDSSGPDLLDFLRIGSPGIRIVVVSRAASEASVLEALSRGAGDWLRLDHHVELELPRRVDDLLRRVEPAAALVETLDPEDGPYQPRELDADAPAAPAHGPHERLRDALESCLGAPAFAGAVYDGKGRPLAVKLVPALDPQGVGFALAMLHAQVGAIWTHSDLKPVSYLALVRVEGGLLGLTAVPGPRLVALLMPEEAAPERALRTLSEAARRIADVG